jgi:ribosomal protein S18 acetylase RimI-like enzyme
MIRLANAEDALSLTYLAQATFRQKWQPIDGDVLVEQYISENMQLSHIQQALESDNTKFFLAFKEDKPVGYLKLVLDFIPEQYAHIGSRFLQVEKLYLLSSAQRLQLGTKLLRKALDIAEEKHYDTIWLGVWGQNHEAIKFYEKFGFRKVGNWFFKMGDKISEDEWLMIRKQKS